MLSAIAATVKIASGIKGLFGKKKKPPSPRENMMSQARGAREAAEKYGFNPLTMMQYGQPGGAMSGGGGPAPLASIELITGGLRDFNDIKSGDAARRRAADQLEIDLAKLKLDKLRSGVTLPPPGSATAGIGTGRPPLGQRPATVATPRMSRTVPKFSRGENPVATGRKTDISPVTNSAGVFELENDLTGGPVTIPGEGEPWGIDEVATAVFVGLPQVILNHDRATNKTLRDGAAAYQKRLRAKIDADKAASDKPKPRRRPMQRRQPEHSILR